MLDKRAVDGRCEQVYPSVGRREFRLSNSPGSCPKRHRTAESDVQTRVAKLELGQSETRLALGQPRKETGTGNLIIQSTFPTLLIIYYKGDEHKAITSSTETTRPAVYVRHGRGRAEPVDGHGRSQSKGKSGFGEV